MTLIEIIAHLETHSEITVADPDRDPGLYAGENDHRPWRVWTELADALNKRLAIRREGGNVVLTFTPLDRDKALAREYGADSAFARIDKLEDPSFVLDLRDALARAKLPPDATVLDVGVNTGNELALIYEVAPDARIIGVDHSESAIATARTRWPRAEFSVADVAQPLAFGRFDLVMSIGLLQSGSLDDRALLRRLVQDHMGGAIIIGVPNCRYIDGEVSYGARMKNFTQPELGLVVKDIAFYRKYLQQHGLQVFVTGRNYLFVTGV